MANLLIRKAIFYEETEDDPANNIPITSRTKRLLLKNSHFRKLLTDELLNAKKNVSGSSAENLKHLYIQLGLHQYALAELKNYKWYIKAQAIQELSIMGLKENLTSVYRFTNNANELVRMEAQIAVVNFYGFEGLRFLDVISHPVTEWQQIQLLHELSHTTENFSGIEKWLKSENKTVVAFALKLAGNYHRFELHDSIVECLEDLDPNVRLQAIISLGEIYTDKTSEILISRYLIEDIKHQMAIVKVLQNIATNDDIPILLDQLNNENAALKLMVARTLAKIGADGFKSLQHHYQAQQYPLAEIIAQIKNELAL
ncbi:HEAT repeat domain-containing protein [Mucilaginibacter sp.]|uniref:HEAT repeat domain-containing protein n=1 Tax=Mucilaginibacter sp. TaxID=1882438 RepID=UPI00261F7402|nr:HEAT repeat domain-containing protein [Mucilaginibacter sp.]